MWISYFPTIPQDIFKSKKKCLSIFLYPGLPESHVWTEHVTLRFQKVSGPIYIIYQFGCGISKMVGPKNQAFCPRISMLKRSFDTNYIEPLMIFSSWSTKSWLSWFSMWNIWNTLRIRCWGNCLHLLGFWIFFVFFPFFSSQTCLFLN